MALLKKFEGFTIWSENYKELAKWYEETFDLKRMTELNLPDDQAISFEIESGNLMQLWIGYHSKVSGKSKDSYRQMISYFVDDIYHVAQVLKSKNVNIIAGPSKSPDGELLFLTAFDPEGNLIQMFQS